MEKPLVFHDSSKPKPPSDDPNYDARYERARRLAITFGGFVRRADEAVKGLPLFGRLNQAQKDTIRPFVQGQRIHDLGAGDLGLASELLQLGAKHIMAIDKEEAPSRAHDPAITYTRGLYSAFPDLRPEIAFLSWPINHVLPDLNRIVSNAKTVVYLGKNTDGTSCGDRSLFQEFVWRELLAYVPDRQNTLIVLGKRLENLREPMGEERAGLAHWSEGFFRYDDVEK